MKMVLSLIALLASSQAMAIYYDITGPCSDKPIHSGSYKTDLSESVGRITIEILESSHIPYVGSEEGINSIINTPTGIDSMEVLSDTKMRAYGWCFSINGIIPEAMSDKIHFSAQNDLVNWFYAYSTYDSGKWLDYCQPAYKIHSPQFCK